MKVHNMTTRKRNEYLDVGSSDGEDEDQGYDSEAVEATKGGRPAGSSRRAPKRRKVEVAEAENGAEDRLTENIEQDEQNQDQDVEELEVWDYGDENPTSHASTNNKSSSKPIPKPVSNKSLSKTQQATQKTGVIYLSSLPPYLKPSTLRSLLEARGFGPITKVFLTPSTTKPTTKKSNRRPTYTDGWLEFRSKRTAKMCAETLNASIVGGKKGGWYHDDVWNMKYLRGFKWADLMEQVQRERGEREASRRAEEGRVKREAKAFVEGVERGKMVEGIRTKRREKEKEKEKRGGEVGVGGNGEVRRLFRQNEVRRRGQGVGGGQDEQVVGEEVRRVLGKIF